MQESFRLSILNTSNNKVGTNLFKISELIERSGVQVTPDDTGKVFNTLEGAENGAQLQKNINEGAFYDHVNKFLYVANFSGGLWVYDLAKDTGSLITTLTDIKGDRLPNNTVYRVKKDIVNNILYVVSGVEVWIYNIDNNTGKRYSNLAPSVDSGDELPAQAATLDFDSNFLYVAGHNYLWRLNLATRAGENLSTVVSGVNYPTNGTARDVKVDSANNLVFVSKMTDGLFSYNTTNREGKIYNSGGGAGNGLQLPNNNVGFLLAQNKNTLFVPTEGGIWIYDVQADTGSVINSATIVNGDSLPGNLVFSCHFSVSENKLYVGGASDWRYDFDLNEGETLGTVQNGANRPAGTAKYICYENGLYWSALSNNGLWLWNEDNLDENNPIEITSNDEGYYEELLGNISSNPIVVSKIYYQCDNIKQRSNSIKVNKEDKFGHSDSYMLQIMKYVSPEFPYHIIPIDLEQPIILDEKKHLSFDMEPHTQLNITFEGEQLKLSELIDNNENKILESEVEVVSPGGSIIAKTSNTTFKFHPAVVAGMFLATTWGIRFLMKKVKNDG